MLDIMFYSICCYFCILRLLLILVLEFVPGSGKTEQLLYDSQTYYEDGYEDVEPDIEMNIEEQIGEDLGNDLMNNDV